MDEVLDFAVCAVSPHTPQNQIPNHFRIGFLLSEQGYSTLIGLDYQYKNPGDDTCNDIFHKINDIRHAPVSIDTRFQIVERRGLDDLHLSIGTHQHILLVKSVHPTAARRLRTGEQVHPVAILGLDHMGVFDAFRPVDVRDSCMTCLP